MDDLIGKYMKMLGGKLDINAQFKAYPDLDLHQKNSKEMLERPNQSWYELGLDEPDMEKKISFYTEHLKK